MQCPDFSNFYSFSANIHTSVKWWKKKSYNKFQEIVKRKFQSSMSRRLWSWKKFLNISTNVWIFTIFKKKKSISWKGRKIEILRFKVKSSELLCDILLRICNNSNYRHFFLVSLIQFSLYLHTDYINLL